MAEPASVDPAVPAQAYLPRVVRPEGKAIRSGWSELKICAEFKVKGKLQHTDNPIVEKQPVDKKSGTAIAALNSEPKVKCQA